jgi:two-component system chemotaxis response regulator CheB
VLDTAENGEDLLLKIKTHQPDLVIADYDLPKNNRMFCFRRINLEHRIPILLLLSRAHIAEDFIFEAYKVGVYDYVKIGTHTMLPQFRNIQTEIVQKVRSVMEVKYSQDRQANEPITINQEAKPTTVPVKKETTTLPRSYIILGASTGGTKALEYILSRLKPGLKTVVLVALHLPGRFTSIFANRLKGLTTLKVMEGKTGTTLTAGKIIVAPGDKNMILLRPLGLRSGLRIGFSTEPGDEYDCPSVDVLMQSVAELVGPCTLGVILTGMGKDGTAGTQAILQNGGYTIAQDETSSVIFGMAKSAIAAGSIKKVLSLTQIPDYINRYAEYHQI